MAGAELAAVLRMEAAAFGYDGRPVFENLSFEVAPGELVCLLGPNGCGKTTLLRCLGGALRPQSGRVYLDGSDVATLLVSAIARRVGFVFQEHTPPFPFPAVEVVRMGRAPHLGFLSAPSSRDTRIADEALELVGMAYVRDKPYTQLSGGERQLVLIARTLAHRPADRRIAGHWPTGRVGRTTCGCEWRMWAEAPLQAVGNDCRAGYPRAGRRIG